jgi:hypothetical protein
LDYKSIADYGVNDDSAALIAADGFIDRACLPYSDSPAIFLRLREWEKGRFALYILPAGSVHRGVSEP